MDRSAFPKGGEGGRVLKCKRGTRDTGLSSRCRQPAGADGELRLRCGRDGKIAPGIDALGKAGGRLAQTPDVRMRTQRIETAVRKGARMSADSDDGFAYEPACAHTPAAAREHYWAVAIGLQAVDGLEVSPYLRSLANDYQRGTRTLDETGALIRSYHGVSAPDKHDAGAPGGQDVAPGETRSASREADLVSQRIAELLAKAAFYLAPGILADIHRYLFQDLDPHTYRPGAFKTERMVKQEDILNGDSVLYADPIAYESSLAMAFAAEAGASYGLSLVGGDLARFCHTVAFLWQIHPFWEGNTRTVAVFSELYLNYLGFSVTNEPFERHSRYYRDALVRAMYRNGPAGILPDESFLVAFYDNLVNGAERRLDRSLLACPVLFEHPELLRNVSPDEALARQPAK